MAGHPRLACCNKDVDGQGFKHEDGASRFLPSHDERVSAGLVVKIAP
jgi:hypothetical protein